MDRHRPDPSKTGLDRRQLLLAASALVASPLLAGHARAAATHSFRHGDFDITVISDGFITLPIGIIAPEAAPQEQADIRRRLGGTGDTAPVSANIPLIRSGRDLILVDNGSGDKFQASAGRLAANLREAGIDPAAVTKFVCTHAHPDHVGGMLGPDGRLSFPNAAYYVSAAEWQFWMDPDYRTSMPDVLHEFARGAQRDLSAVRERVTLVKPGDDIVTGLRVLDTAGHTPGHVSLELDGREGLIITGDAATNVVVSFEHPDWKFGFDMLHDRAIPNRRALLERAATDRITLLGYHWTYPGVGYAERQGGAYRFAAAP
jgi:glyoxylase-like metal-dependent hydrolase (beta-lactamase superfamily II)